MVTPDGEIPCRDLSRISDDEMKTLMIEVVTYLTYPEILGAIPAGRLWDRHKLDEAPMKTVRPARVRLPLRPASTEPGVGAGPPRRRPAGPGE